MPQLDSVVVYDGLPIRSGGGHGIQRLDSVAALDAWRAFLDICTHNPAVQTRFEIDESRKPSRAVLRQLKSQFGDQHEWLTPWYPFPPSRLNEALAWLERVLPVVTHADGQSSVQLAADANFHLRRADGGVWEGQESEQFGNFTTPGGALLGVSATRLTLSAQRSMSLTLSLPLATDEEAKQARSWLQPHLPFRISDKHWTRWTLDANGRTYRPRRLDLS
jgi:hypothetical protein